MDSLRTHLPRKRPLLSRHTSAEDTVPTTNASEKDKDREKDKDKEKDKEKHHHARNLLRHRHHPSNVDITVTSPMNSRRGSLDIPQNTQAKEPSPAPSRRDSSQQLQREDVVELPNYNAFAKQRSEVDPCLLKVEEEYVTLIDPKFRNIC